MVYIMQESISKKALLHSPIFLDLLSVMYSHMYVCTEIRNNIKEKGEEEITACGLDVKLRDDIAGNMIELETW